MDICYGYPLLLLSGMQIIGVSCVFGKYSQKLLLLKQCKIVLIKLFSFPCYRYKHLVWLKNGAVTTNIFHIITVNYVGVMATAKHGHVQTLLIPFKLLTSFQSIAVNQVYQGVFVDGFKV